MSGWIQFATFIAASVLLLYLPGYLILRSLRFKGFDSVCLAPILSCLLYVIFFVLYDSLDVSARPFSVILPSTLLGLLLLAVTFSKNRSLNSPPSSNAIAAPRDNAEWYSLALSVAASSVLVGLFFVKQLDGPSSVFQAQDNGHHLATIQTFLSSHCYSPFGTNFYSWDGLDQIDPYGVGDGSGFYPSLWHCLVTLVADLCAAPVGLSVNAFNTVLACVVFPVSMCYCLRKLFPRRSSVALCGAAVMLSSVSFPWAFLTFGPLYPNLMAFSLVPLFVGCFVSCFTARCGIVKTGLIILSLVFVIALAQPNGVITSGVLLAPYIVGRVWRYCRRHWERGSRSLPASLAVSFAVVVAICLCWVLLYYSPIMKSVVAFTWDDNMSGVSAFRNIATFAFTSICLPQMVLVLLIAVGVVRCCLNRRHIWLVASLFFTLVIYFIDVTETGFAKHLLAGFWYTDTFRLAAMTTIAAIPLASLGLEGIVRAVTLPQGRGEGLLATKRSRFVASALTWCLVLSLLFFPGSHGQDLAFGYLKDRIHTQNRSTLTNVLDEEERAFCERVQALVNDNDLIINCPGDGSVFMYGLESMNLYYRQFSGCDTLSETDESRIIRNQLCELSWNPSVEEAVRKIGASYVLVLDKGGEETSWRKYFSSYHPEQWKGLNSLDDDTPGFDVVLSEGDMRLYKIG